ncbi:Uncharacterized protein dnm_090680 [Desulfonema magnum]|uniref:Uncharacterized protein n=1 Tax=Desulfonema magnum TaxID=45655 RepID=A0A975BWA8_9BACT|nr:Uncharacterized protein dnm_090680 [Desulfonema magnum]
MIVCEVIFFSPLLFFVFSGYGDVSRRGRGTWDALIPESDANFAAGDKVSVFSVAQFF